ncbi:MAG: mandelate racemase/muconate lactonizing enzyme family protein [Pseudomonadota bacterium]
MKLQGLETFVIGNPPPRTGGRYFIVVRLKTACGITGIGEIYAASFGPKVVAAMAEDVFARWFEGSDPARIETLWRRTYSSGYSQRPDPSLVGVLSGLEMACWDIRGKALDQPVHALLGGKVHERLRTYTYLYPEAADAVPKPGERSVYSDPDLAAERAAYYLDLGFTGIKFDPAGPYTAFDGRQPELETMERCELFCKRLREAAGARADLLFGSHGQFTASGAIRLARRIEPYDPLWFEEPTPPEMPEEMAKVAARTAVPIATGERLCTKYEFARVLSTGAASILQPALGRVGGLWEAKKIAAMAETHYAVLAPHLYAGPVEGAANIHLAAATPNFLILESIERWEGFHADMLTTPIRWEDGYVIPSDAPGIGVELNDAVVAAHPYEEETLHLTMEDDPL